MRHVFVVRPFVTVGTVAVYFRFGMLFDEKEYLYDAGLLAEMPILEGGW